MPDVCPRCCPDPTDEAAIPVTADVRLAPAECYWSTSREKAVKLRRAESGPGSEPPLTIYQMFQATVDKYGDHPALCWKKDGAWEKLTYNGYRQHCRTAAKSFLKVLGLMYIKLKIGVGVVLPNRSNKGRVPCGCFSCFFCFFF